MVVCWDERHLAYRDRDLLIPHLGNQLCLKLIVRHVTVGHADGLLESGTWHSRGDNTDLSGQVFCPKLSALTDGKFTLNNKAASLAGHTLVDMSLDCLIAEEATFLSAPLGNGPK